VPVQLEDRFVNPALMPRYLEADFNQVTPNQVLASVAQVREADQIIEAILPDAHTRAMLRIKASEPCLLVYRVARIEGGVSSIAWLTYPGSRYRLSSRFRLSGSTLHGD
jgi:GntR family histidine utilization transcriptional repressor